MTRPRVLVVRSGANPFLPLKGSPEIEVVEKVSHTIEPIAPPENAFAEAADLAIFTSQVAVERVASDPLLRERFLRAFRKGRVAAVGPATAEALRAHGIEAQIVAGGSGEAVLDLLPARLEGWRILLPCGQDSPEDLTERLRLRGARAERVVVYRKTQRPRDAGLERDIVARPFAAFCATSPSAAEWLFDGLSQPAAHRLRRTPAVALGRFTRRFLEGHGVERIELAGEPRFSAALRLLEELATVPGGA